MNVQTMMLECMDYQHLTKVMLPIIVPSIPAPDRQQDRSLGYVELKVSDLAKPAAGDSEFIHESTGKRVAAEPIRLDKGSYKGKLHYEAEFVPAIPVKGVGFESGPNLIQRAAQRGAESEGEIVDDHSSTSSMRRERTAHHVPEGITVSRPLGLDEKSEAAGVNLSPSSPTSPIPAQPAENADGAAAPEGGKVEEGRPEEQGKELSKEELLQHRESNNIAQSHAGTGADLHGRIRRYRFQCHLGAAAQEGAS